MELINLYKTSKGLFLTEEEANRKINKQKINDLRDLYHGQYEKPIKCFAILAEGKYFLLNEVSVKDVP